MRKIIYIFFVALQVATAFAQPPAIIPQPAEMLIGQGKFTITEKTGIHLSVNDPQSLSVAEKFNDALKRAAGFQLNTKTQPGNNVIHFNMSTTAGLGEEGYILSVNPERIQILAEKPAGLFYAVQSLLQLLPKEIEAKSVQSNISWTIPSVEIRDKPRFGWRGAMLDVSRHFFTKQEVKQFIDDIARYKYNLLHFHLTDDQGWRIEIKSYPKLTEVGAWNVKKTGRFGTFAPPANNEPRDYGGFYTQDDIRELVQYARERYVNILPEIDVPGHSMAAVASYPDLSCTPGTYKVNSGEPFMDWHNDGTFTARVDNTLCPANEKVYEFLDKVFTEVAAIFFHWIK